MRDSGNELYVIAGGSGSAERIANGKVNVPTVCWKIIVVLPQGDSDLSRINKNTRVIAVSMPNRKLKEIADSKWSDWLTTVTQLEKTTGYNFLSALPDSVEKALEANMDTGNARTAARSVQPEAVVERPSVVVQPVVNPAQKETVTEVPVASTTRTIVTVNTPGAEQIPAPTAQGDVQVWVNTRSGVYHMPGARWYGNTKQGGYMTEAQAHAQGYRAAAGQ